MKCSECKEFKDDYCSLAREGHFSEIGEVTCLLRLILVQLQNIYDDMPGDDVSGDEWKI